MKNLKQYIYEDLNEFNVKDVKVIFDIEPSDVILQIPENFTEDQVMGYIGDRFLKSLPSDAKVGEKKFGNNFGNINDAYFEYDKFEMLGGEHTPDFEWDAHYSDGHKSPELKYCKLSKIKYIILFDMFTLMKSDGQDTKQIFDKIFYAAESNDANKYPITIKYNSKESQYTEE